VRELTGIALGAVVTGVVTAVFLLGKAFPLARYRVGLFVMMANVIYETLAKKLGWSRWAVDIVLLPSLAVAWALLVGPWVGLALTLFMGGAWLWACRVDEMWQSGHMAYQDGNYRHLDVPLPLPRLIVWLRGPVLARGDVLELGHWPLGHEETFEILVLNPSAVVPQLPLTVAVNVSGFGIEVNGHERAEYVCPDPGELATFPLTVRACRLGPGGKAVVRVAHGDQETVRVLHVRTVVSADDAVPVGGSIERWKGGARAGFAWRGDQDLYDPATFQSAAGLQRALELSERFRLPSTLFLSARLSLLESEHRAFSEHFGWDRRSEEIHDFAAFLREEVTIASELEFPMGAVGMPAMEVGNHMYLHLGTHAAADPANGWKSHAWIGEGDYEWHRGEKGDSFTEQRDNAIRGAEAIRDTLGVEVTSWGVPGRVFDSNTAAAVEAAGMEVGSDTDASAFTNVLRLVPPHHPKGCERLVELTKKYPGDPNDAYKIAMLKYWLHAARRTGRAFIFMAHHHLLGYESKACYHLSEEFFRHVLADCHGDFYVATITSLGRYWRDVLSPRTRCVQVSCESGRLTVINTGDRLLTAVPVEVEMKSGGRFMKLVDLPAHSTTMWVPEDDAWAQSTGVGAA
jgi:hypothetical protein